MHIKNKLNLSFILILLTLPSCGNDTPSTSEVKELIVNEGVDSGRQQIKSILYDYFYTTANNMSENFKLSHVTEDAYGGIHGFQAMAKLDQIKEKINLLNINDRNLRKVVENFVDIKSANCYPKKGFNKFYDCSVNLVETDKYNSVLKTFNISFHRMDNGSLSALSTSDFYIPDGMNVFTALTRMNATNYFINISPEKETIDPSNNSTFFIKNKKMYFNLMNDLKAVEMD